MKQIRMMRTVWPIYWLSLNHGQIQAAYRPRFVNLFSLRKKAGYPPMMMRRYTSLICLLIGKMNSVDCLRVLIA